MKHILLLIITSVIINANIIVKQNIKALYRDTNITEQEKNYIELNQDINVQIVKKELQKRLKKIQTKEKIVISFILTKNRDIKNFKFLVNADDIRINRITKNTILSISKKFIKPKKDTMIRFIIDVYKIENIQNYDNDKEIKRNKKIEYEIIYPGTTRFDYSSKEFVRVFETSEDGFVNINASPSMCATFTLLTNKNQKIRGYMNPWNINQNILKGKYKLLIKVKKKCNVNIQYIQ